MRLDHIDIRAFGTLRDVSFSGLAGHDVVVLLGGNESGKSTLREFLGESLYGFRPGRLADHAYAPQDGSPIAGKSGWVLDDGTTAAVERSLAKMPEGMLTTAGGTEAIGNHPLPWVGSLSSSMFRSVHAMTFDSLSTLSHEAWDEIERRLLGGTASCSLRSIDSALATLDRRATIEHDGSVSTRSVDGRLGERLQKLRGRRELAAQRLARLLEIRAELADVEVSIELTRDELQTSRARLSRAEVLLPVLRRLEEVARLRTLSTEWIDKDDLPDDVRGQYERLSQEARQLRTEAARLDGEIEQQRRRVELTDAEHKILKHEDAVRSLFDQSAVHQQDLVHVNDLDRDETAQQAVLDSGASPSLSGPFDAEARAALDRLSFPELRERVKAYEETRRQPEHAKASVALLNETVEHTKKELEAFPSDDEMKRLNQRERALMSVQMHEQVLAALRKEQRHSASSKDAKNASKMKEMMPAYGMIGAGIVLVGLLIGGAASDIAVVGLIALALIGAGVMKIKGSGSKTASSGSEDRMKVLEKDVRRLRASLELDQDADVAPHLEDIRAKLAKTRGREALEARMVQAVKKVEETEADLLQAQSKADAASGAVAALLAGFPIAERALASPDSDLLVELEKLRDSIRAVTKAKLEREAIVKRCEQREAQAQIVAATLGETLRGKAMDAVGLWFERLQQAVSSRQRASEASAELERLEADRAETQTGIDGAGREFDTLSTRLRQLDPDSQDPGEGLNRLEQARSYLRDADSLERSLHAEIPDWAERRDEAQLLIESGEDLDLPAEERASLRDSILDLDRSLNRALSTQARLIAERDELVTRPKLHDIEGEIAGLEEQRTRSRVTHDRMALLSSVLREGELRYRDRYQHELLRSASSYVSAFTGGRYSRVSVDGSTLSPSGTPTLSVVDMASPDEPSVPVASPMSRATRSQIQLALRLALADQLDGAQALPVFLDEAFVDWDDERIGFGAATVRDLGQQRQVIVSTSRADVAQRLASEAGARVIELGPARRASSTIETAKAWSATPASLA